MPETARVGSLGDLNAFTTALIREREGTPRTLEEYLRAVLASVRNHSADPPSYGLFATILAEGFSIPPLPYDETLGAHCGPPENPWLVNLTAAKLFPWLYTPERLAAMESRRARISDRDFMLDTLLFLIADFHSMTAGELGYKWRYMGAKSPRGHDWYNWDPLTFLECALAGFTTHVQRGHVIDD